MVQLVYPTHPTASLRLSSYTAGDSPAAARIDRECSTSSGGDCSGAPAGEVVCACAPGNNSAAVGVDPVAAPATGGTSTPPLTSSRNASSTVSGSSTT